MRKKLVQIVEEKGRYYARYGKMEVRPTRGGHTAYANVDAARRNWRKAAARKGVTNYSYSYV